ncbi:hypothetical protein DFQ30_000085 [Apophysomyces sp. BC1015]|nr:hypothetical protein DFQ30_000085 [Apophysomyces sp. BC1015]
MQTYASHLNGTPDGAEKSNTEDGEGGVDEQLVSGTAKPQELYLEESLLGEDVVGSVNEGHGV